MMKQKKIIVPILTLAVMLLMVGGVYTVFSSTQPEKSKAENVRDTTDQDYEKGLTEEQKAFNELINKQIYEETANNLEQYEQYGLTYNSDENQLFFNGKSVCYFADNRATDGTFEGTEVHSANGDICWRTHSTCGPPKFTIQSMTKTARSSINSMVLPPKKHRPSSG